MSASANDDLCEVATVNGRELFRYKRFRVDVALERRRHSTFPTQPFARGHRSCRRSSATALRR